MAPAEVLLESIPGANPEAAVPQAYFLLFWKRAVVSRALISFLKPQHHTVVSVCSLLPSVHFLPGFKIVAGAPLAEAFAGVEFE